MYRDKNVDIVATDCDKTLYKITKDNGFDTLDNMYLVLLDSCLIYDYLLKNKDTLFKEKFKNIDENDLAELEKIFNGNQQNAENFVKTYMNNPNDRCKKLFNILRSISMGMAREYENIMNNADVTMEEWEKKFKTSTKLMKELFRGKIEINDEVFDFLLKEKRSRDENNTILLILTDNIKENAIGALECAGYKVTKENQENKYKIVNPKSGEEISFFLFSKFYRQNDQDKLNMALRKRMDGAFDEFYNRLKETFTMKSIKKFIFLDDSSSALNNMNMELKNKYENLIKSYKLIQVLYDDNLSTTLKTLDK
ncbi:MAG: hypothetical protein IJ853_02630 [Rickettsiales bacterium]|nr:hypothetical protein [Rickettsiales bacterium]